MKHPVFSRSHKTFSIPSRAVPCSRSKKKPEATAPGSCFVSQTAHLFREQCIRSANSAFVQRTAHLLSERRLCSPHVESFRHLATFTAARQRRRVSTPACSPFTLRSRWRRCTAPSAGRPWLSPSLPRIACPRPPRWHTRPVPGRPPIHPAQTSAPPRCIP